MKTSGGPALGGGRGCQRGSVIYPTSVDAHGCATSQLTLAMSLTVAPALAGVVPFECCMILNVGNIVVVSVPLPLPPPAATLPAVAPLISPGRLDISSLTGGLRAFGNISFFNEPITGSPASVSVLYFRRVWDFKKKKKRNQKIKRRDQKKTVFRAEE